MLAAAALAAGLLAGCSSGASQPGLIMVNGGSCGTGWQDPHPGLQTFRIYNGAATEVDVALIDPANGSVYAEASEIGQETTAPMQVDLGSGRYAFKCLIEDGPALTGPVVTIGGNVRGDAAILPVTANDLVAPARQYHAYVTAGLAVLVSQTRQLAAAVQSGDLAAARAAWLPAHLTYERLGAAYGTFGDYDGEIDGRADGLPGGVNDPGFTGFYRLEYGLWHGQSAAELTGPATQLASDVSALNAAFPAMEINLLDIGLRTHEILENALQFQLSGHDDYGSGTTLATTAANITGTRELLSILHPLLVTRYKALPSVTYWLNRLQTLVDAQQQPNGTWPGVSTLPNLTRQKIDAAAGQALQELAPIAVITQPRRTS